LTLDAIINIVQHISEIITNISNVLKFLMKIRW